MKRIILKNAKIFNGVDIDLIQKTVIIEHGLIVDILSGPVECDGSATVIDLAGKTLSPGFIDCHMHMALDEVPDKNCMMSLLSAGGERLPNAEISSALIAASNAAKVLNTGFTTVFDGGAPHFIDASLKEAIALGLLPGPDLYTCRNHIVCSPSHFPTLGTVANGVDGIRAAVRNMIWWNADFIKIQMSPPVRMVERNTDVMEFTSEELLAAVDEAHRAGLPVHAHLRGAHAIKESIACGIDVVIHGTGIDDEGIELMLEKNMYLLPTLDSPPQKASERLKAAKTMQVIKNMENTGAKHREGIRRAYKAGVKIAFSTDAGAVGVINGENAQEFFRLRDIGMSNLECLRAATSEAAKATRLSDKIGRIEKGYKANLIVLPYDPTENLEAVLDVQMVMKDGKIVRNSL